MWFIPYAYEYMILFDLVRDHVNPTVRAVGKSELRLNLYIVISFGEKG